MDSRILVFLLVLGGALLSLMIGVSIGSGEVLLPFLLIVVLAGLALVAKPRVAALLAVTLVSSGLTAPGLPGQFGLYYVAIAAVTGCALLLVIFKRSSLPKFTVLHQLLAAFSAIVLITGFIRGFGFQWLGSSMWGGFIYISIVFPALLVFVLPIVNMPANWWRPAIIIMGLLSPIPLIADLMVVYGIPFGFVRLFMQTGATIGTLVTDYEATGGLTRLTSAGIAAQSMIIAFLAVVHTRKLFHARNAISIGVLVGIVILSLVSGFRMMTALIFVIILFAAFLQRTINFNRLVFGVVALTAVILALYATSHTLPYSVQRAISWLPGIGVSQSAAADAAGTITWRLDLWEQAVRYIPDYFWIGKGFSYDADMYLASMRGYAAWDSLNWALVTGAYHNGYLSLILLLGIFGLLTGIPLLIGVVVRHLRINREAWNDSVLQQCHQAFLASEVGWMFIYLTIYGDVSAVFPQFFFNWAVMEAIRLCDRQLSSRARLERADSRLDEQLAVLE